jgi:hypothetical protein
MMRWKTAGGIAVVAIAIVLAAFFTQKNERREIDAKVFAEMAKNPWDLKGDLLWGYYFTSSDKASLERSAWFLERVGYRIVGTHKDQKHIWWLHIEKTERHTLDSMAGRNVRLAWFAKACGFTTYDGWDVGQVPNAKKG